MSRIHSFNLEWRKWVAEAGAKHGFGRRPNVMPLGPAGTSGCGSTEDMDLGLSMRCLIGNDNQYKNRPTMRPETTFLSWIITNKQHDYDTQANAQDKNLLGFKISPYPTYP
ncbi:hypothetical protein CH63R_02158 [Colletotrichum higginsianum IMI 349063]|uniref:Uncharacterized protein n=1 Tax=Colletotrichum higginsianum (strain IMI 349063) TaxID=759273 RepID=A0A1B7YNB6_COLHI|nr:hypothetical protein CH63R_02158 [Colletotrichum higginsianum IMI 349063]OBR13432.1 hypothetical protein CH63R_02158 [Colletotrichum higginsianum IMI 349063]